MGDRSTVGALLGVALEVPTVVGIFLVLLIAADRDARTDLRVAFGALTRRLRRP